MLKMQVILENKWKWPFWDNMVDLQANESYSRKIAYSVLVLNFSRIWLVVCNGFRFTDGLTFTRRIPYYSFLPCQRWGSTICNLEQAMRSPQGRRLWKFACVSKSVLAIPTQYEIVPMVWILLSDLFQIRFFNHPKNGIL